MGDHQIAARDLLWALGSCCALAGRAFDAQLVLQQVPPPHTLASLVSAARALGLQARLRTLPLARLASERGPLVLRLRGDDGASSLGLLVRVDDEAITWIPAGSHEPLTQDISSFAPAYGGEVVQLRRPPEPAPDPDRSAPAAFGLRWFVPELLKHRKVWRDVLGASLLLQLLAPGLPLFTQALNDKVATASMGHRGARGPFHGGRSTSLRLFDLADEDQAGRKRAGPVNTDFEKTTTVWSGMGQRVS